MAYEIVHTKENNIFAQNQNTNNSMFLYVPNNCSMNLTENSTQKRLSRPNSNDIQCVCVLVSCQWRRADKCQVSLFAWKLISFSILQKIPERRRKQLDLDDEII